MAVSLTRMTKQQSRAWVALISTAELLPAALDAQLQRDSALTHYEFMLLGTLKRSGAMRVSELAAATNATVPRTSKVASRLQQRGLLERAGSDSDRRIAEISLSGEGRRRLVHAMPSHFDTVHELVLDHLSTTQLDALADALEPIIAALDPQHRFGPQ